MTQLLLSRLITPLEEDRLNILTELFNPIIINQQKNKLKDKMLM